MQNKVTVKDFENKTLIEICDLLEGYQVQTTKKRKREKSR